MKAPSFHSGGDGIALTFQKVVPTKGANQLAFRNELVEVEGGTANIGDLEWWCEDS